MIDIHTHIYPDIIREKVMMSLRRFYDIPMTCQGNAEDLLEKAVPGFDKFVVLGIATSPRQVKNVNDFILGNMEEHKELIGFCSVHPDFDDNIGELERVRALGIKGVKLHPDNQGYKVDDPKMDHIYDYLRSTNTPVLIHCGDYRYDNDNPERIANVLNKFPGITLVAAHLGGWLLYDRALDALKNKDCYLDSSSSIYFLGKRRAKEIIREYGAERIIYGTDYPMADPRVEFDRFESLGLTSEEESMILTENAKRLLNL